MERDRHHGDFGAGWFFLALIPLIWLTKKSQGGH